MSSLKEIKDDLQKAVIPGKAKELMRFFKTGPGDYGEGDLFIGVTVPEQRKFARRYYKKITLADLETLLQDPCHEYRLTALLIIRLSYEQEQSEAKRADLVKLYLNNLDYVNNWDLVDSSAPYILGPHLYGKDPALLDKLATSGELWRQRVAILATYHFIKQNQFDQTLTLAEQLLEHPHDLIHKAVGWMLREVGNRDHNCELEFLKKHHHRMPRTMLRYATEKFEPELRKKILAGQI
jgi:3-methyladenine DNA glycosylase AlkD